MPRSRSKLERTNSRHKEGTSRHKEGTRESKGSTQLEERANSFDAQRDAQRRQVTATEHSTSTRQESESPEKKEEPQKKSDRSDGRGKDALLERQKLQKRSEGDQFDPLKNKTQEAKAKAEKEHASERSEEHSDRPPRAEKDKTNKLIEKVANDSSRRNILYALGNSFSQVGGGAGNSLNEQVR